MDEDGPGGWIAATLAGDRRRWFDHQWGDFITAGGGGWDWSRSTSTTGRT